MLLYELAKIEIQLITEISCQKLEINCSSIAERSFLAGFDFYQYWINRNSFSLREKNMIISIYGLLKKDHWAQAGFYDAEDKSRYDDYMNYQNGVV